MSARSKEAVAVVINTVTTSRVTSLLLKIYSTTFSMEKQCLIINVDSSPKDVDLNSSSDTLSSKR
jgi:hypothetical protein